MKHVKRGLALCLTLLMLLSSVPVTKLPALMESVGLPALPGVSAPTAEAAERSGDGSRNIDFNYETENHIYNAMDGLNFEAAKGRENITTTEAQIMSNYDNLNWKHVTQGITVAVYKEGTLRNLLTSTAEEDTYISLTGDLLLSYTGNTVWETMTVTKDKVLDLNGYRINVMYGRNRRNKNWNDEHYKQSGDPAYHNSVFITVAKGATLTIIDSSAYREDGSVGGGTGGITFHGYMVSPHYSQMNFYTTRDLFHVNGNLVIYGGTYQAGRQKDQLKSGFSWSKLKTVIGDAVSLGVAVAEYATGISAATAAYSDVNETIMNALGDTAENDHEQEDAASSTNKKDGSGAKAEVKKDTPTEKGRDDTGAGRNQTVGEKKDTTNAGNAGTAKPTDGKNQSNDDGTAKKNGSTKEVDYASRLAKAEKGVVDSIVNKSKITDMVDGAFKLVDGIAGMFKQDENSRVTQSIMGTVVRVGNTGTFVSYGGTYKGFGSTPNTRNAVIEVVRSNNLANPSVPEHYNGGQVYIYDGTFEGYTGANIFNMVRANANQQRVQITRDTRGVESTRIVTLSEQETGGMEQVYFENQEEVANAPADKPVEPILINTKNVTVRGGTFRCYYEMMNMGIAEAGGSGEANFVKFPGTPGSVNLGIESYGKDMIRDGRIQITDLYGDGALVLMDEEKDDSGERTGVYHYRLFCSDEELRYKTYLTVGPNDARTNSTYSMRLVSYYGDGEQQDISEAWETTRENPRDAAFSNDEKYFTFPIDSPWHTNAYYVTPQLENTDPKGQKLSSSNVWYYSEPLDCNGEPIKNPSYGNNYYMYKNNGSVYLVSNWHHDDAVWNNNKNLAGITELNFYTASYDAYRTNMKWFTYKIYRVDPLTKESISEDPTYGSDVPLAKVVYGCDVDSSLNIILNLKDMEAQVLKQHVRLRDGTEWTGYRQGEIYRVVFSVEEYLAYGKRSDTMSDGILPVATAETSVMFACYSVKEMVKSIEPGVHQNVEEYTPLQWLNTPDLGETAKIGLLNGFAGVVDFEENANKIFDVYYQWWEIDENGKETTLLAGTDNVYIGDPNKTYAQNLADKKKHTPDRWQPGEDGYIYVNTVDPADPYKSTYGENGLPRDVLLWRANMLHAYTKEMCSADMTMLALNKEKRVALTNNDVFATNTDSVYIPMEFAGKRIRVKCIAVNIKFPMAYDSVQVFYSHVLQLPSADAVITFKSGTQRGTMDPVTVKKGTKYTLPACAFTSANVTMTFEKWDAGYPGEKITVTKDMTVTAQWCKKNSQISFSPGEGKGAMPNMNAEVGQKITLPESTYTPPSGQVFGSWSISYIPLGGGNRVYDSNHHPGEEWTVRGTEVQITASYRWYRVTFDPNGGGGKAFTSNAVNGTLKLPACTFTPPAGKRFVKWSLGNPNATVTVTADVTATAVWGNAIVSFTKKNGTGTMADVMVNNDGTFTVPKSTFAPPVNMAFDHWECNGKYYYPGQKINVATDMTLTAVHSVAAKKTVTVYFACSYENVTVPGNMVMEKGSAFTFPEPPAPPAADSMHPYGYYFDCYGYKKASNQSTAMNGYYQPGDTVKLDEDCLIYIFYKDYMGRTVIFGSDIAAENMPENQTTVFPNGKVTQPEDPYAEGYEFLYWTWDSKEIDFDQPLPKAFLSYDNNVLKAKWRAVDYTVSAEAAAHGSLTLSKETANIRNKVQVTITPEDGYEVESYRIVNNSDLSVIEEFRYSYSNSKKNGGTVTFTMPAADVTVYANFKPKDYAIDTYGIGPFRVTEANTDSTMNRAYAQAGEVISVTPYAFVTVKRIQITNQSTGVKQDITATGLFTMPAANVAVSTEFEYKPEYYYKVFVGSDCNGTATISTNTPSAGETVTLTATPNAGYRFVEWKLTQFWSGEPVNRPTNLENNRFVYNSNMYSDVLFTAVFAPIDTVTVTFGSGGEAGVMDSVTVMPNTKITLPECAFYTYRCKAFNGWKIGSKTYQPGQTYTVTKATSVTALWKDAPHTPMDGALIEAPTCTESGVRKLYCYKCNADLGTKVAPALGHFWDVGVITKTPTATEDGEMTFTCSECGETMTQTIPAGTVIGDDTTIDTDTMKEKDGILFVVPGVTGAQLLAAAGGGTLKKEDGTAANAADPLATGMTFEKTGGALLTVIALGDSDKDGKITAGDARLALRRAVDLETYPEGSPEFLACNVDGDDKVTAGDARMILRAAVELEDPRDWLK